MRFRKLSVMTQWLALGLALAIALSACKSRKRSVVDSPAVVEETGNDAAAVEVYQHDEETPEEQKYLAQLDAIKFCLVEIPTVDSELRLVQLCSSVSGDDERPALDLARWALFSGFLDSYGGFAGFAKSADDLVGATPTVRAHMDTQGPRVTITPELRGRFREAVVGVRRQQKLRNLAEEVGAEAQLAVQLRSRGYIRNVDAVEQYFLFRRDHMAAPPPISGVRDVAAIEARIGARGNRRVLKEQLELLRNDVTFADYNIMMLENALRKRVGSQSALDDLSKDLDRDISKQIINGKPATKADLEASIAKHTDDSKIRDLLLMRYLARDIKLTAMARLGSYGKAMAVVAMSRNIKLARLHMIADDLEELVANGYRGAKWRLGANEFAPLAAKLRARIKAGRFEIGDTLTIANKGLRENHPHALTQRELNALLVAIPQKRVALVGRSVSDTSFAYQALGAAGKPLWLKMKSDPLTGYVTVRADLSSKVDAKMREQMEVYTKESLHKVYIDDLPTSIPTHREVRGLDGDGQGAVFIDAVWMEGGRQVRGQILKSEMSPGGPYAHAQAVEFHADPRTMHVRGSPNEQEVVSSPELLAQWRQSTEFAQLSGKNRATDGQEFVDSYAEFLVNTFRTKNGLEPLPRGSQELTDAIASTRQTAEKYTSDIDLASIATTKTGPGESLQGNAIEGFYFGSQHAVIHNSMTGFTSMGMQPMFRHPSEVTNLYFPQTLRKDYPLSLVYTKSNGEVVFEEVQVGTGGGVHNPLFKRIAEIREETGLNIMINPADIIRNPRDYLSSTHLMIPEQIALIQKYYRAPPEVPGHAGDTALSVWAKAKQSFESEFTMLTGSRSRLRAEDDPLFPGYLEQLRKSRKEPYDPKHPSPTPEEIDVVSQLRQKEAVDALDEWRIATGRDPSREPASQEELQALDDIYTTLAVGFERRQAISPRDSTPSPTSPARANTRRRGWSEPRPARTIPVGGD